MTTTTLTTQIKQMEADVLIFEQRLGKLRERIAVIHQELGKIDTDLSELSDLDHGKRGNNGHGKIKNELLTQRTELESELASLPGQAASSRSCFVHTHLLLLKAKREAARAEAHRLQMELERLDSSYSTKTLEAVHVRNLRRHGHLTVAQAEEQTAPIRAEITEMAPHVKAKRAELNRAQGRAASQADIAKTRYGVSLDGDPAKWDEAAQRLATEEKELVFRLCFPLLPWPRPIQPRPKIFAG